MEVFSVHILAADRTFFEGECVSLVIPTITGMYGILAHHSNMISAIVPGTLSYQLPGQPKQIAAVSAGLVKVEDNDVLILADSIERPEEIDENRARRSLAAAKEALLQKRSLQEYKMVQANLARALNRLNTKNYGK